MALLTEASARALLDFDSAEFNTAVFDALVRVLYEAPATPEVNTVWRCGPCRTRDERERGVESQWFWQHGFFFFSFFLFFFCVICFCFCGCFCGCGCGCGVSLQCASPTGLAVPCRWRSRSSRRQRIGQKTHDVVVTVSSFTVSFLYGCLCFRRANWLMKC